MGRRTWEEPQPWRLEQGGWEMQEAKHLQSNKMLHTARKTLHVSNFKNPGGQPSMSLSHVKHLHATRSATQSGRLVMHLNHPYASMLIHTSTYNIDREV